MTLNIQQNFDQVKPFTTEISHRQSEESENARKFNELISYLTYLNSQVT